MSATRRRKAKSEPAADPRPAARRAGRQSVERLWVPHPLLFAALILMLGFWVYSPALSGPFVFDDFDMLEAGSAVRTADPGAIRGSGRPLLLLSFVLNHRLAGGFNPLPFHLTNVLLHCLNALLLWGFASALFSAGRVESASPTMRSVFVYGLPLLFLLSPIQTESVAYISSRSEVLAATFYIAGLWAFVAWRERRPWLAAIAVLVFFVLTALTKQDKLTFPFAILLLDYLLLSRGDWRGLLKSRPLYGLFGLGLIAGFFVVVRPFLFTSSAGFALDWKTYLFTQFRMVFRYLGQLLAPVGLNLDPDIAASASLGEHGSWLALIVLIGLVAAAAFYHRRAPLPVFGFGFFLLALAPTTSFYPLLDFAAERRLYLPAIGFLLVLLWALGKLFETRPNRAAAAVGVLAALYALGAYQHAKVWADDRLLWEDTVAKSPQKERPWTWLGRIYQGRGMLQEASQAWGRANQVVEKGSRQHAYLLTNLGLVSAQMKNYEQAVDRYREALEIIPRDGRVWSQLAVALMRLGRSDEGWQAFEQGFQFRKTPEMFTLRAQEYFVAGRYLESVADYERVVRALPEDAKARRNLAAARSRAAQNP